MNLFLNPLLAQAGLPADNATETAAAAKAALEVFRAAAHDKASHFQFTALTPAEWIFLAEYYGLRAIFVLTLMILAWTISGWMSNLTRSALHRIKFDETLSKFISKFVRWLILGMVALGCISKFGIETTSFAAVIGAAGLAVGLAFQGTLSNFAAGAMLLIFRPYKVGDVVNTAGILGVVNELALFTTEIDTFDGRRIIVPNSSIFGSVIENVTYHPRRRVDIDVGTAYEADIDQTRQVLEEAITKVPAVLSHPEPAVVLQGLGASSVDWSVRGWANNDDFGKVKQGLIRAVKMSLDKAQIGIPYPQMDVHVDPAA